MKVKIWDNDRLWKPFSETDYLEEILKDKMSGANSVNKRTESFN